MATRVQPCRRMSLHDRPGSRDASGDGCDGDGHRPETLVLPVRIELTASPFITLPVSGRLRASRGVRALDHPFIVGRSISCDQAPLDAARLASTPSRDRRAWLGIAAGVDRSGFPEFERFVPSAFPRSAGKIYQGSALPLSYGSRLDRERLSRW